MTGGLGVRVLAEQAACERRGIEPERIGEGITLTEAAQVADLLIDSTSKVVWL